MLTFAPELKTIKEMSEYTFGIPFKITCSGEAASQFYKPLQNGVTSTRRAVLEGVEPSNVARKFFIRK